MTLRGHTSMTLMAAMLFATAGLFAGMADAQPVPGAKTARPAATGPSPEENLQKQLPPPAKPEELRAPTQADMETHCLQNPKCRAKLEQAKQGKRPVTPLPAATEPSPEEKFLKSLPPPAQGLPPTGPMGPKSHIPGPVERFFSLLNPFTPDLAWAQTGFSVILTPQSAYSATPYGYLIISGAYICCNAKDSVGLINSGYTIPSPYTDNKPYVFLVTSFPAAGYYLIDVMATASLAKLRHQYNGPILETWDYRAGCGASTCHYVTVDYYAAGWQNFYFWADPTMWGTYFYSITIKSYP